MMVDDDGVIFNPFMIGPSEYSQRYEYKQPTYVTYPPYATLPKEHTNKSVSKGTFFAKKDKNGESCATSRSQMGEMCFSRAIKKDMAAAKQMSNGLNDEGERIYAGRAMQTSEKDFANDALKTIMPIRSKRSLSQDSNTASSISAVKATTSLHTSRLSVRSHVSKDTDSNVTLKPVHKDVDTDLYDNASHASQRSTTREPSTDKISHHARRKDHQADNVSHVSTRSQSSQKHSQTSVKPKLDGDIKNSSVSVRSKTTERQTENVSRVCLAGGENQPYNLSIKSKSRSQSPQSIEEVAESIQKELAKSMETTKALSLKAAELNERLRAGNEFNHNRFNTLARQFVQKEPLKRCREDRMAFWYKDSVIS
ncbi:hypothetical protein KR044_011767 [Drosophila immigrans]|nr:hypothetical protein KR044_011767 [Drosophila immigrans]